MTLLAEVASFTQLVKAWKHVKKKDSPGIDDKTVENFSIGLRGNLKNISKELQEKKYEFNTVLETEIPKKDKSKLRKIRIFTLRDKIVQKSLQLTFEKKRKTGILFPDIRNSVSIGFLEKLGSNEYLGVKKAIKEVKRNYRKGYHVMTSADIQDFFDEINQDKLFKTIKFQLSPDDSLDWLIKKLLNPKVVKKDRFHGNFIDLPSSKSGVSQGSIISPLLSNIYLAKFDKKIEQLGIPALRYADDFAFFSKSMEIAKSDLEKIKKILLKDTKLSFHPNDSNKKPAHYNLKNNNRHGIYLGIKFERKHLNSWVISPIISKIDEVKKKIKNKLDPQNDLTLIERISFINRSLKGWMGCYKHVGCTKRNLNATYKDLITIYGVELNNLLVKKKIIRKELTSNQLTFLGLGKLYKKRK